MTFERRQGSSKSRAWYQQNVVTGRFCETPGKLTNSRKTQQLFLIARM